MRGLVFHGYHGVLPEVRTLACAKFDGRAGEGLGLGGGVEGGSERPPGPRRACECPGSFLQSCVGT